MGIKIEFNEFGPVTRLRVLPDQPREPGAGEVVVEHRSIAVNAADWKVIAGLFQQMVPLSLPLVPGSAAAGVVVSVGDGVVGFSKGDPVVRSGFVGSFRTQAVYPAAELRVLPTGMSMQVAASLPGGATTGYALAAQTDVSEDDVVLIHGAAGGVGSAAALIAVQRGARVLGTSSAQNQEYLRRLGVEPIPYGDGLLERVRALAEPSVVIDAVGSPEAVAVSVALRSGSGRAATSVPTTAAAEAGLSVVEHRADELDQVIDLAVSGVLRYPSVHTFPLSQAVEALQLSSSGHFAGKILLEP